MSGLLIIATGVVAGAYLICWANRRRARVARLLAHAADIEAAVNAFSAMLGAGYVSHFQYVQWKEEYGEFASIVDFEVSRLPVDESFAEILGQYKRLITDADTIIGEHNRAVTEAESKMLAPLLDKRSIRYNTEQLAAAVSEEDNTLLVAGAGTGKTTTILGKVAYLVDRLGVSPEDILVLSFTEKAVKELQDRMGNHFPGQNNFRIQTFHGFGYSLLGKILGEKPSLAFENADKRGKWIQKEFDALLKSNPTYLRAAVQYFAFHLKKKETEPSFSTLDEYYRYQNAERIITFQKEQVKSYQEAMIANYLFMNGIEYKYEAPYEIRTADETHRQYQPDFYLSDYGIYLEHFGIDRAGNVHFVSDPQQNARLSMKYREDMKWKQSLHDEYATKLITTYSYDFSENAWEERLLAQLKTYEIPLNPRPLREVLEVLSDAGYLSEIVTLFGTFLDLAKSNHYSAPRLKEVIDARNKPREMAFGTIFLSIYEKYEAYLAETRMIDFHDMLNKATELIEGGAFDGSFKYIIIDEFQDFSVSKNHMIQALRRHHPETKLFCVGDDWQSIFRFAGSDVSLMTHFDSYHGYTNHLQLTTTNRFDSSLARITNKFIMQNPSQIRKDISARHELPELPLHVHTSSSVSASVADVESVLSEIAHSLEEGRKAEVLLLGRYNFDEPKNIGALKSTFPNLNINFLTIHRSKGLEADFVIVLNVVEGMYGFPSSVADDPVLRIVLSDAESYPHAEERRLMYVALTRTRSYVHVMTVNGMQSPFIRELERELPQQEDAAKVCGVCGGRAVQRSGPYSTFWGCKNYPDCRWTEKIDRRN